MKNRATERPVADAAVFFVFTFLITWGTGMVLVFSNHASIVNGAHPVEHPIPLPLTVAIVLALVGGFGPFLADTARQIFKWLLEESHDDKGDSIRYDYKGEDAANVPASPEEYNKLRNKRGCKPLYRVYQANPSGFDPC